MWVSAPWVSDRVMEMEVKKQRQRKDELRPATNVAPVD
jgi:hypothetical protein